MRAHYRLVVLGGTFHGCGRAAREPDSLVVETGVAAGWEFSLTLCPGHRYDAPLRHDGAAAFLRELRQHGAVNKEGRAYPAAFTPLLSAWCIERGVHIAFNTWIVRHDGPRLTLLDAAGPHDITADHIVDARPAASGPRLLFAALSSHPGRPSPGTTPPDRDATGPFIFHAGAFDDVAYASLPIDDPIDWPEARASFLSAWADRPASLSGWRMDALATRFHRAGFDHPALALDHGLSGDTL